MLKQLKNEADVNTIPIKDKTNASVEDILRIMEPGDIIRDNSGTHVITEENIDKIRYLHMYKHLCANSKFQIF